MVGIIVPREGGLAISLTEKLEDMVSIIFLPLVCSSPSPFNLLTMATQYFALTGLSTNLGLLNNGMFASHKPVLDLTTV